MSTEKKDWIHPFERTGLGKAPFRVVGFAVMKYQAHPDAPVQPGSSCDHCGTGIMNVFWVCGDGGEKFKVGIDCVQKTLDTALRAQARKAAKAFKYERAATERKERVARDLPAFLAANPGIEDALACSHKICIDLASKLKTYGSLSLAQVDLAFRLYAETFCPAERPVVPGVAPINGGKRQTIRGRIVSVKDRQGYAGRTEWKIVVKVVEQRPDANYEWLCWGSLPKIENRPYGVDLRNHEIEFVASLKEGRESHFAFFSRPTKARLTEATVAEGQEEEPEPAAVAA